MAKKRNKVPTKDNDVDPKPKPMDLLNNNIPAFVHFDEHEMEHILDIKDEYFYDLNPEDQAYVLRFLVEEYNAFYNYHENSVYNNKQYIREKKKELKHNDKAIKVNNEWMDLEQFILYKYNRSSAKEWCTFDLFRERNYKAIKRMWDHANKYDNFNPRWASDEEMSDEEWIVAKSRRAAQNKKNNRQEEPFVSNKIVQPKARTKNPDIEIYNEQQLVDFIRDKQIIAEANGDQDLYLEHYKEFEHYYKKNKVYEYINIKMIEALENSNLKNTGPTVKQLDDWLVLYEKKKLKRSDFYLNMYRLLRLLMQSSKRLHEELTPLLNIYNEFIYPKNSKGVTDLKKAQIN